MKGQYKGKLYSEYNDTIRILLKMGRLDEAEKLIIDLINTIEAENNVNNLSLLTGYYANLANIYHKRKDISNEIKVLERFVGKNNTTRTTLHDRLVNLKGAKA